MIRESDRQLMQMADSLEELATMICGHGFYAYHKDDRNYPIPEDAVREYLEVGAMFQQSRIWHPKTERPNDESQIMIDEGDGCGTAAAMSNPARWRSMKSSFRSVGMFP